MARLTRRLTNWVAELGPEAAVGVREVMGGVHREETGRSRTTDRLASL